MKIEVVITIWDEGVFKSRNRIEADDFNHMLMQMTEFIDDTEKKIEEEAKERARILALPDDDDIPF